MHRIEPHFSWRNHYIASEDALSPFYGREYSEFVFTNKIYNHLIHPQWDNIGSPSLFIKILHCDYDVGFSVIELFGEWNDCINNDIMFFKRDVVELMIENGINKFILVGENVLNFHGSDECYYEEWFEEISVGWILMLNFRTHVLREFEQHGLAHYCINLENLNNIPWRTYQPLHLFQKIDQEISEPNTPKLLQIKSR